MALFSRACCFSKVSETAVPCYQQIALHASLNTHLKGCLLLFANVMISMWPMDTLVDCKQLQPVKCLFVIQTCKLPNKSFFVVSVKLTYDIKNYWVQIIYSKLFIVARWRCRPSTNAARNLNLDLKAIWVHCSHFRTFSLKNNGVNWQGSGKGARFFVHTQPKNSHTNTFSRRLFLWFPLTNGLESFSKPLSV